jgi:hypothetical protein
MLPARTVAMTALTLVAFGAGWLAKTSAQTKAPAPLITYFSHEKVDASFVQALATTGSKDLFIRKTGKATRGRLTPTAAAKRMKANCIPMKTGRPWWSS